MCSDLAISVKNLTKSFRIFSHPGDRIKEAFSFGQGRFHREFNALHNVTFEIRKGDAVGIIGRNGSGKSTLLQLICGILKPSSGSVYVDGRICALLELGSGFNPEFTGRENVYFQGAVVGLTKLQMDERLSDIVSFADIGEFIDQPVRTYSSGMFVRLAFSVIAHMDADILVVDEALAVGDAFFTQKCMRFLRGFMKTGTVLFVTHDMGMVRNLCNVAICIDNGVVSKIGSAKEVVDTYMQLHSQDLYGEKNRITPLEDQMSAGQDKKTVKVDDVEIDCGTEVTYFAQLSESSGWESGKAKILSIRLLSRDGQELPMLHGGELVSLEVVAEAYESLYSPIVGWFIKDRLGQSLFGEHTYNYVNPPLALHAGEKVRAVFCFQIPLLPNGDYSITVSIAEGEPLDHIQHHWLNDALIINVASEKLRYGLVGIPFSDVSLKVVE